MQNQDIASIEVTWRARLFPLAPIGAAARGNAARALARRLLARDDEALGLLKGVAGSGVIIVLGEEESLPWVDGVSYLGRDERAPSLVLPTVLEPSVPPELFERA